MSLGVSSTQNLNFNLEEFELLSTTLSVATGTAYVPGSVFETFEYFTISGAGVVGAYATRDGYPTYDPDDYLTGITLTFQDGLTIGIGLDHPMRYFELSGRTIASLSNFADATDEQRLYLNAPAGNTVIRLGDGDDRFESYYSSSQTNDLINGGSGNDYISAGYGIDTIDYRDSPSGIVANIWAAITYQGHTIEGGTAKDGWGTTDLIGGFENVQGSDFNDVIIGSLGYVGQTGDNLLQGFDGNDTFAGLAGNDTIDGGDGSDTVIYAYDYAPSGHDGDHGVAVNLSNRIVDLNADPRFLPNGLHADANRAIDGFGNVDALIDVENALGTYYDDQFIGNEQINIFEGLGGRNVYAGGRGNDTFIGTGQFDIAVYSRDDHFGGTQGIWANLRQAPVEFENPNNLGQTVTLAERTVRDPFGDTDTLFGIPNILGTSQDDIMFSGDEANFLVGNDGDDFIDAGGGQDEVFGGKGSDHLLGGEGSDLLDGGIGNDVLYGSIGWDNLLAREGDDTIDFSLVTGLEDVYFRTTVDGGADSTVPTDRATYDPSGDNRGDILILPGNSGDYHFEVQLNGSLPTWETTHTRVLNIDTLNEFDVVNVEGVRFSGDIENEVTLTNGLVSLEMLTLAREVYGELETLSHGAEPLAWQSGGSFLASASPSVGAQSRGWHAVSAMELGIRPADYAAFGDLEYSFVNGHYQAINTSRSLLFLDRPEANALVLTGEVDDLNTLAVVFRGTDQVADFRDYFNFADHYANFAPLTDVLRSYIAENDIEQMLVSGHSLGAGMVQYFIEEFSGSVGTIRGYTDGSPGADNIVSSRVNSRIVNFVHTDDLVPQLGDASHNAPLRTALTLGLPALGLVGTAAAGALENMIPKYREGSEIRINSEISSSVSVQEHDSGRYIDTLGRLIELSNDPQSVFYNHELARSLRNDTVYAGSTIQIAPGTSHGDIINSQVGDRFVLAGAGFDQIQIRLGATGAANGRLIDGGSNIDTIFVWSAPELATRFTWNTIAGGAYEFRFDNDVLATLYNVERIVVQGLATPITLGQQQQTAQIAAPGTNNLVLNDQADYADAGDGAMTVTGSSGNNLVYVGKGSKEINLGDGDDIVLVRTEGAGPGAGDALTIDGGAGSDILSSGNGNDAVDGGLGTDTLMAGGGNDILSGGEGNDTLDGESGVDRAVFFGTSELFPMARRC